MTASHERLQRLAHAYAVAPTLEAVADAIIRRTALFYGTNERGAVIGLVTILVERDGVLTALEAMTGEWPEGALNDIVQTITSVNPAMPWTRS